MFNNNTCDESSQECLCGVVPDAGSTSDVCGSCTTSADCADGSGNSIPMLCVSGICQIAPNQASGTCDSSDCMNTNTCDEATQACECGVTPVDVCGACSATAPCVDLSGQGIPLQCVGGICQIQSGQPAGSCDSTDCALNGDSCNESTQVCVCVVPDGGPPADAGSTDAGTSDVCGPCTTNAQCVNKTGGSETLTCEGGICQISSGLCDNTNCSGAIGTCNETTQICRRASKTSDRCQGPCTTSTDCAHPTGTYSLICKLEHLPDSGGRRRRGSCSVTHCPKRGHLPIQSAVPVRNRGLYVELHGHLHGGYLWLDRRLLGRVDGNRGLDGDRGLDRLEQLLFELRDQRVYRLGGRQLRVQRNHDGEQLRGLGGFVEWVVRLDGRGSILQPGPWLHSVAAVRDERPRQRQRILSVGVIEDHVERSAQGPSVHGPDGDCPGLCHEGRRVAAVGPED